MTDPYRSVVPNAHPSVLVGCLIGIAAIVLDGTEAGKNDYPGAVRKS